jgi:SAM-dependent methyltransferase
MVDIRQEAFFRSGIAALSDLQTSEWRDLFNLLEREQAAFLSREREFRSPEYKWPLDPLHNFTRVWEYPYVYANLGRWRRDLAVQHLPRVVDLGSGVTFFPFAVAKLECHVTCVDIDPICEKDLNRAIELVPQSPGKVDFRMSENVELPFADGEVDAVYCISVLEHVPDFEFTIQEMSRVLGPQGLLILTIDLALGSVGEIRADRYRDLMGKLRQHFQYIAPDVTTHPGDKLDSHSSPFRQLPPKGVAWLKSILRRNVLNPLRGIPSRSSSNYPITVQGFVMCKSGHRE